MNTYGIILCIFLGITLSTELASATPSPTRNTDFADPSKSVKTITALNNLRFGAHPESSRILFDLSQIPKYSVKPDQKKGLVTVHFFDTILNPRLKNLVMNDLNIKKTTIKEKGKDVTVTFFLKKKSAAVVFLPLIAPTRLLLDISTLAPIKGKKLKGKPPTEKDFALAPENIRFVKKEVNVDEELDKDKARVLYNEGIKLFSEHRLDDATASFEKLLKYYPDYLYNDAIMFIRALITYARVGNRLSPKDYHPENLPKALDQFTKVIVKFPDTSYRQDVYFLNAQILNEMEFYPEALGQLNLILDDFPLGKYAPDAIVTKAEVLLKQDKIKNSTKLVDQLLQKFKNRRRTREVVFELADTLYDKGKKQEAFNVYVKAQKAWPHYIETSPVSAYYFGNLLMEGKQYDKAIPLYLKVANFFPSHQNSVNAMNKLAQIYLLTGRDAESMKVLKEVKKRFGKRLEADESRINIADLQVHQMLKEYQGDYQMLQDEGNPFKTYEEIIQKTPSKELKAVALFHQGKAFRETHQFTKSIETMKKLLRQYPKSEKKEEVMRLIKENFKDLISLYYNQDGFFTVLLTYYRNFEKFLPDIQDPAILVKIAESYIEMGVYQSAEHFLKRTLEEDTMKKFSEEVAYRRIDIANRMGAYSLALKLSKRFLKTYDYEDGLYRIATIRQQGYSFYKMGNLLNAEFTYMESMFLDDYSMEAAKVSALLGDIFLADGNKLAPAQKAYADAVAIYEKNKTRFDTDKEMPAYIKKSYTRLAQTYFDLKEYRLAIDANRELLKRFPKSENADLALYLIAESYHNLGQTKDAKKVLKELLNLYPNRKTALTAQATLEEIEWEEKNRKMLTVRK